MRPEYDVCGGLRSSERFARACPDESVRQSEKLFWRGRGIKRLSDGWREPTLDMAIVRIGILFSLFCFLPIHTIMQWRFVEYVQFAKNPKSKKENEQSEDS